MKFTRNTHFYIAKNIMDSVFVKNEPLDYEKWVNFINTNNDEFIWNEKTESGISSLANIDKVPDNFKSRILGSLNKVRCFKDFDTKKNQYNINCAFSAENNWVSIGFERTPKLADLKFFVKMANYLDAFLFKDGIEIINETLIDNWSKK